jgi:hypothetical protein
MKNVKQMTMEYKMTVYNYHQDLIENDRGYGGSITKRVRERFSLSAEEISEIRKEVMQFKTIEEIADRKRKGIDNTEDESAEIKQYIKNHAEYPDYIKELFPLEYDEAIFELFNN